MKHSSIKGTDSGTILFIHGNSSSSEVFKKTVDSEEIPYTKITVDLPGHGANVEEYDAECDFSIKSYQEKLLSFIEEIDDDILLVGNSMGGHLAIELAPKIKNLKGLIIMGTPPVKKPINFEEAFLPQPALQTFLTENPSEHDMVTAAEIAVHKQENAAAILNDFKQANPKVRSVLANDLIQNRLDNQERIFSDLDAPKFIIRGTQDPTVNPSYLETITKQCNGTCTLIDYDECGHYPSLEQPDKFIKTISEIASQVF
ncbi:alpha/beta fold hydrolase [Marixanthomonas ophiurae]|uniref:Alpha/beta hydrolase n=1 Tax=Marixanthomonas ophiurae TaxID=387659 RepID=A0A3E1Q8K6_9FLAO|nr:alpha/beta hydrolase [Marixanthomonas ophiurae]RFN58452.1 alpha/beta hydrolase [Marixanthomonas ophiurae]